MINTIAARHGFARPYSQLAANYDVALGIPNFIGTRAAFERLISRYNIRFRSAADIGCGTGLFACYLSQCWGVPVFGVDRSAEMLAVAARNCCNSNVCFLLQDIRCLRLPCPVDLITANFDTLNHLLTDGDLKGVFRRVYSNLRPGGYFVFDLITDCQSRSRPCVYVRHLRGAGREVRQRIHWEPRRKLLSILVVFKSRAATRPACELHRERAYSPADVARWLLDAGFMIRGVHDAVTLRVASHCPPRIIVVARKKPLPR